MKTKLLNLYGCAKRLNIPAAWLKRKALDGDIPYLQIGKRQMRFELNAVKKALVKLAENRSNIEVHKILSAYERQRNIYDVPNKSKKK